MGFSREFDVNNEARRRALSSGRGFVTIAGKDLGRPKVYPVEVTILSAVHSVNRVGGGKVHFHIFVPELQDALDSTRDRIWQGYVNFLESKVRDVNSSWPLSGTMGKVSFLVHKASPFIVGEDLYFELRPVA